MNVIFARAEHRKHRLLVELNKRLLRAEQSRRGYFDDQGSLQGGLMAFIRHYWHVLEPETELVEGWALYAIVLHLEAVTFGEIKRLLITVPPGFMKSLCTDVFWPAWEWGPQNLAHLRYIAFSYSASLTERDNNRFRDLVLHPSYKELWGRQVQIIQAGSVKISNSKKGWKLASSVGGVGTGERGNRIILDDAHNIKEAESEVVRTETVRWFRESMSDRMNDLVTDVIVAIMQRSHSEDVAGAILDLQLPYCHLMIPMEYDWDRQTDENGEPHKTAIGWFDPRYVAGEPEKCNNTLAWVERFPEEVVESLRTVKGPYAYCTPAEAPILMADLSLKPIGNIQVGDKVLGFTIGNEQKRARHKLATVLSISKSVQPLVKITMESGEVIRCTADHKWFTGRNDSTHPPYAAAFAPNAKLPGKRHRGMALSRVCPAVLPELTDPGDIRAAGWLGGFFDGEGTIVLNRKHGDRASPLIGFTQGTGRNKPLCDKLEATLKHFGFAYGSWDKLPQGGMEQTKHRMRFYWLKAGESGRTNRLPMNQRFLHIVQPVKWRDRLIETMQESRMFTSEERVASIEPDSTEEVYGLETTTGNYVVWGLASSNSGQYQQAPAPRGGGIFKRAWWQVWDSPDGTFPQLEYILASLDGAFTEKESNSPSALTVWGIFLEREAKRRRIILLHAWRKFLEFSGPRVERLAVDTEIDGVTWPAEIVLAGTSPHIARMRNANYRRRTMGEWGLVEWCADTCDRFKVDKLLIEAKASGMSAASELENRYRERTWAVELQPVCGDKYSRALAVQPTFSQLLVYAPVRDWAEMVIEELEVFPKHKYKDLTDSTSQALKYLREVGLASTDDEAVRAELERVRHRPQPKALYPV